MGLWSKVKGVFKKDITETVIKKKYPQAFTLKGPLMKAQGKYQHGFPEGIIVHFTAGHQNQSPNDAIAHALQHGYRYFFIDEKGHVFQQFDLANWGYHAGESICPVTKRAYVSKYYVGIEVACGGKLTNGKTWFGKAPNKVNKGSINNKWQKSSGEFEAYTEAQEKALIDLCAWLCKEGASPDLIFGHEEVSAGRKDDPGLSLSMSMDEFREKIKIKYFTN